MAQVYTPHNAERMKRLKLWRAALLLLSVALILGAITAYIAGNTHFSTARTMHANWGISIPNGLREVEHTEEKSFHGDGYRFTVFEIEDNAQLRGTFFDLRQMSIVELTSDQIGLVTAVTNVHRPENYLLVPQANLRKAERFRDDNTLLVVHDEATNRFYVYESFI